MRVGRRHIGFVVSMAGSLAIAVAAVTVAGSPAPSKGQIPDSAWSSVGALDLSQVPDYVSQLGRDGNVVGYVSKVSITDPSDGARDVLGRPMAATWPVFADDLKTVVGHMVPDKGFIPLGVDPSTVDTFPARVAPGP
jgi:hypothetical protein